MADRSFTDRPRELLIESRGPARDTRELYSGGVLSQFLQGIVRDSIGMPIDIELPPNQTRTLRIRQTGETETWYWAIHELTLWEIVE